MSRGRVDGRGPLVFVIVSFATVAFSRFPLFPSPSCLMSFSVASKMHGLGRHYRLDEQTANYVTKRRTRWWLIIAENSVAFRHFRVQRWRSFFSISCFLNEEFLRVLFNIVSNKVCNVESSATFLVHQMLIWAWMVWKNSRATRNETMGKRSKARALCSSCFTSIQ